MVSVKSGSRHSACSLSLSGGDMVGVNRGKNPRYSNGNMRRKHRARFKAMGAECGICKGKLGPIHYDEPSNAQHPLSFVIDEIKPVARWREWGYDSPQQAAQDWNNLQAAHYWCNQQKGAMLPSEMRPKMIRPVHRVPQDGQW